MSMLDCVPAQSSMHWSSAPPFRPRLIRGADPMVLHDQPGRLPDRGSTHALNRRSYSSIMRPWLAEGWRNRMRQAHLLQARR